MYNKKCWWRLQISSWNIAEIQRRRNRNTIGGEGGRRGCVRGCKAADYSHEASACEGQESSPLIPLPLQKSVKVCQSRLHCFHFPCSVIPYTHQPGKTFSLTASIVLFSDPPETTASIPHRIKVSMWTSSYPSNTDSSNCCPFLGQHSESFQVAEKSYGLE